MLNVRTYIYTCCEISQMNLIQCREVLVMEKVEEDGSR